MAAAAAPLDPLVKDEVSRELRDTTRVNTAVTVGGVFGAAHTVNQNHNAFTTAQFLQAGQRTTSISYLSLRAANFERFELVDTRKNKFLPGTNWIDAGEPYGGHFRETYSFNATCDSIVVCLWPQGPANWPLRLRIYVRGPHAGTHFYVSSSTYTASRNDANVVDRYRFYRHPLTSMSLPVPFWVDRGFLIETLLLIRELIQYNFLVAIGVTDQPIVNIPHVIANRIILKAVEVGLGMPLFHAKTILVNLGMPAYTSEYNSRTA